MGEVTKFIGSAFSSAPGTQLLEIDSRPSGDDDGDMKTLTVVPVVEGRQAVATGVCGGQHQQTSVSRTALDRIHPIVGPYREGAAREFDVEPQVIMNVAVAGPDKSDRGKCGIKVGLRRRAGEDEIHVDGYAPRVYSAAHAPPVSTALIP